MSSWLIVVGERRALDWILAERRMAFRSHINTSAVGKSDRFALYVTRGAFHNPTRDESQILATGVITSAVERSQLMVANEEFDRWVKLRFDRRPFVPRTGVPFRHLVPEMSFIRKKANWFAYVRKALVPIPDGDLLTIQSAVADHRAKVTSSS